MVVNLSSSVPAIETEESKDYKDYPHTTTLELRDKDYRGSNTELTISMWESAVSNTYKPPQNCGHPNPFMNYGAQKAGLNTYKGNCVKIQDVPKVGTLYGRNKYETYTPNLPPGTYDWYYLRYGNTLLALESFKTITGDDAASIFAGLTPISPAELLTKSKALAQD
jgi:hypothetical protein